MTATQALKARSLMPAHKRRFTHERDVRAAFDAGDICLVDALDAIDAIKAQGDWIPHSGETEIRVRGRRLLWCWQPTTGRSAYLDLDTDILLEDEAAFGLLAA